MSNAQIVLLITLALILLLLSFQKVFIRFVFSERSAIIIEYFPFMLILYDFFKKRKKKKKLIKSTKKIIFFLPPLIKSLLFLLNKSNVQIYNLLPFPKEYEEPHKAFLKKEVSTLLASYIGAFFYSLSKESTSEDIYQSESFSTSFDIQMSTRLYNIVFSGFVFVFLSIKKKGRIKKFV